MPRDDSDVTVPIPILPYVPQQTTAVSVEVQPLDADHRMHAMPLHAHTFFELLFFTRGSGVHQVGGSHHPVTAGTTFVVAPGVTHDARALQGAEGWVVLFLPDSVNARLASGLNPPGSAPSDLLLDVFRQPTLQMTRPITMDDAVFDRSIQLIETMAQELADKPLGYEVAVRSALQLLLCTWHGVRQGWRQRSLTPPSPTASARWCTGCLKILTGTSRKPVGWTRQAAAWD